jgi:hypothetical protein
MPEISNVDLRLSMIPAADADWGEISKFALTLDGYAAYGSFDACADLANRGTPQSLLELRSSLFFEQRKWRHFGREPDREALDNIRSLVERIRSKVAGYTATNSITSQKIDCVNF